jgi:bacterioferritin (cytochrome b1)
METSKPKLIETLKKQIKLERKAAKACADKEKMVDNPVAKSLLYEMQLDSLKHSKILQSLVDALQKRPVDLWSYRIAKYVDSRAARKALEEHVTIERGMLEYTEAVLKQVEDEGARVILQHILDDEKKHHQALKTILARSSL